MKINDLFSGVDECMDENDSSDMEDSHEGIYNVTNIGVLQRTITKTRDPEIRQLAQNQLKRLSSI